MWQGREIYQSLENSTRPAGKERTTERNKNKILRETGSGPPTAGKMLVLALMSRRFSEARTQQMKIKDKSFAVANIWEMII